MNKNLTIIDADSIAYFCGHHETIDKAIVAVDSRIENIIKNTNADYISLFISKGKYFRHDVFDGYKANRTGEPPKWMRTIKTYLEDKYEANWMPKAEADDLVAYWMNKDMALNTENGVYDSNNVFQTIARHLNTTMAAIDKDLLFSIPGHHYNYTFEANPEAKAKKKANKEYKALESEIVKGWMVETNDESANYFRLKQLIIGDNGDNIKTPFPDSAGDWFVKNRMNFNDVVSAYILGFNYETHKGMKKFVKGFGTTIGLFELAKNYRLLKMLDSDENFMREIGQVPPMPTIIDVKSLLPEPETKKVEF